MIAETRLPAELHLVLLAQAVGPGVELAQRSLVAVGALEAAVVHVSESVLESASERNLVRSQA